MGPAEAGAIPAAAAAALDKTCDATDGIGSVPALSKCFSCIAPVSDACIEVVVVANVVEVAAGAG